MIDSILIILLIIIICKVYFEVNHPKVHFVKIESSKFSKEASVKILQITDYHNSDLNEFVLKNIQELVPDIIVITGDLIDKRTKNYNHVYRLVEKMVKINPNVYFVSGNHEYKNKYTTKFLSDLSRTKINIFNNMNHSIDLNNQKINICGVGDVVTGHSDIHRAIQKVDKKLFTILLSHSPDIIEQLKNIHIDLILSGHTHGGQIRLPLLGAIIGPGKKLAFGLFPKYSKGLYHLNHGTLLYIDSGVGTSRMPIRFFNSSQLSLITITGK